MNFCLFCCIDLAGEMCQISQMLRDQKNLVQNLMDFSILGKKSILVQTPTVSSTDVEASMVKPTTKGSEDAKKKLLGVLEKVEGAAVSYLL